MEIVVDSHALFWFLSDNSKLSRKARSAIEEASAIVVPSIVVMEILYILEKYQLSFKFVDFLSELKNRTYNVYPLDLNVITQTLFISDRLEMHDRIIVATAQILNAPLATKDKEITRIYPHVVWYYLVDWGTLWNWIKQKE